LQKAQILKKIISPRKMHTPILCCQAKIKTTTALCIFF
jgi:hypothetical protein